MDYLTALGHLHAILHPLQYMEVGCQFGHSLSVSRCPSIGIDPSFEIKVQCTAPIRLFQMNSDDFFNQPDIKEIVGARIDLAFIDGLHLAENALRDFVNLERLASSSGVIVTDDVLPPSLDAATRLRATKVWTGDVYRIVPILREYRPDLHVQVYDVAVKGMCVISRLDPESTILSDNLSAIEERLASGDWEMSSVKEIRDRLSPRSVTHFVDDIMAIAATRVSESSAKTQINIADEVDNLLRSGGVSEKYRTNVKQKLSYLLECLSGYDDRYQSEINIIYKKAPMIKRIAREIKRFVNRNFASANTLPQSSDLTSQDREAVAAIKRACAFDVDFYLRNYAERIPSGMDSVEHYCHIGWKQGLRPAEWFNPDAYVQANPIAKANNVNPFVHYVERSLLAGQDNLPNVEGRLAVYTAITGGYDKLKEPLVSVENVDFFVFTDGDIPKNSIWQKRNLDYYNDDPVRRARFIKTHPHLYLREYEWSIWIDANLKLLVSPLDLLGSASPGEKMSTWEHPLRNCVYEEAAECVRLKKDSAEIINFQIEKYRSNFFPTASGLLETSVIVRRHMDQQVVDTMNEWWSEIDNGSRRDQLSLPVVLRRTDLSVGRIAPRGICMRTDHRFAYASHGS